eukprot:jgi/Ulvmu1/11183/UM072_0019.1
MMLSLRCMLAIGVAVAPIAGSAAKDRQRILLAANDYEYDAAPGGGNVPGAPEDYEHQEGMVWTFPPDYFEETPTALPPGVDPYEIYDYMYANDGIPPGPAEGRGSDPFVAGLTAGPPNTAAPLPGPPPGTPPATAPDLPPTPAPGPAPEVPVVVAPVPAPLPTPSPVPAPAPAEPAVTPATTPGAAEPAAADAEADPGDVAAEVGSAAALWGLGAATTSAATAAACIGALFL